MLYNIKFNNKGGSCYEAIFLLCKKKICYIAHPNLPDAHWPGPAESWHSRGKL